MKKLSISEEEFEEFITTEDYDSQMKILLEHAKKNERIINKEKNKQKQKKEETK